MSEIVAVLAEESLNAGRICSFSHEVLFCHAGAWVADALPRERLQKIVHFCKEGTPTLCNIETVHYQGDFAPAFTEYLKTLSAESVLVIRAPAPELTREAYDRLIDTHLEKGNTVQLEAGGRRLGTVVCKRSLYSPDAETVLVNSPTPAEDICDGVSAFYVQRRLAERINMSHIARGVMIFAPDTTYIAADAQIGAGTQILPGSLIRSGCTIGTSCVIGPNTILEQSAVGDDTTVNSSQIYESTVGAGVTVGPFAYIRPGCVVGDHARIGDFVELKNSKIGNGTKVSHLTYIGDAEVGARVNFGCGTVVVNYDGYVKNKTIIGDDCFIGCNTNLIAPLTLGNRVFTAAGTTVTKDVPDGALTVARVRQRDILGWNDKRREGHGQPNSG